VLEAVTIYLVALLASTLLAPLSFWHTFFGIYAGWYSFSAVIWVYALIVDSIVFRLFKHMMIDQHVQMMVDSKMPADEFPHEDLGTYLDRVIKDEHAPGLAKFHAGVMAGHLECHTRLFPKLRLRKIYDEARLRHRHKVAT
jgi:hypothetical protein